MQQDLGAALSYMTRELRRAGQWNGAANQGIWTNGNTAVQGNPFQDITIIGTSSDPKQPESGHEIRFSYEEDQAAPSTGTPQSKHRHGFRLEGGQLKALLGAAGWQAITNLEAITVTRFNVGSRQESLDLSKYCEKPCPTNEISTCPSQQLRHFDIAIAAQSTANPRVERHIQTSVRMLNDKIVGQCPK